MFGLKWFSKKRSTSANSAIKLEMIKELNENSIMILSKKKIIEQRILQKIEDELNQKDKNDFLLELKQEILALQKLDFVKKIDETQLKNEIVYLKQILINKNTTLNEKELRFCAYFRLGFNTKEISTIESFDLNEVRLYKTVIRRKLNLNISESLKDYLVFEV